MTNSVPSRDGFADEYPFESHWLDLDGVRMHFVDEGPRDGEPVLCVHGNPTWSFIWRRLIRELSPQRRVIAVDHIGCGFSDKPQEYPYRLEQHVTNLRRLIESLDLKNITLVGHDWGGCIGMGAATEVPDRFARFVAELSAWAKIPAISADPLHKQDMVVELVGAGLAGNGDFASTGFR